MRRSFSPPSISMRFGNSEAPNHGEWIIGEPERRSLRATAPSKICNYHSLPTHDRLTLPKYDAQWVFGTYLEADLNFRIANDTPTMSRLLSRDRTCTFRQLHTFLTKQTLPC